MTLTNLLSTKVSLKATAVRKVTGWTLLGHVFKLLPQPCVAMGFLLLAHNAALLSLPAPIWTTIFWIFLGAHGLLAFIPQFLILVLSAFLYIANKKTKKTSTKPPRKEWDDLIKSIQKGD